MSSAEHPRLKVVYVLGSSRSGSTILDGILGTGDSALSTGELAHLFWAFDPAEALSLRYCSCGLLAAQCPVWSTVWSELSANFDMGQMKRNAWRFDEPGRSIPTLALAHLFRSRAFRDHLGYLDRSLHTVAQVAGVRAIIDSSKGAGRGWLCSLLPPKEFDVRFVHVVRDGQGVVSSMIRHYDPHQVDSGPSPWPPVAAAAFASAHWVYMNVFASLLGALNRPRYLRVSYEELVGNPIESLDVIERFVGLDLSEARRRIAAGEPLALGHMLAGNRSKASPVLKLRPRESPRDTLALGPSLVFLALAGWLQWAYRRPRSARRVPVTVRTEAHAGVTYDR